jgi:hypothetical protein
MENRCYGKGLCYTDRLKKQLRNTLCRLNRTRQRLANPVNLRTGLPLATATIKELWADARGYERIVKELRRELDLIGKPARPELRVITRR